MTSDYNLVILNKRGIDPETEYGAVANVGIKDGHIAALTQDKIGGKQTIDATGHVVAPEFIDPHAQGQRALMITGCRPHRVSLLAPPFQGHKQDQPCPNSRPTSLC
jgi:N-acyl-D-aspartate/D-glutamate deacylase